MLCVSSAQAQNTEIGKRLYDESCAGCHGATGAGDGELAGLLNVNTPDLTGLSARHDGKFPMLDVIHIIDGRTGVRAHGGPMPVFGAVYGGSTAAAGSDHGSVIEVHGRILSLALPLESLQKHRLPVAPPVGGVPRKALAPIRWGASLSPIDFRHAPVAHAGPDQGETTE
jgi:hypothetical protein